jgi:hypothetical protein
MAEPHLRQSDVTLVEESETMESDGTAVIRYATKWVASVSGRLRDGVQEAYDFQKGGPLVEMSRVGGSANEALKTLREAVEAQGWELR